MRKSPKQTKRPRLRHGLAAALLSLLPLLVIAGVFAPGVIAVQYEGDGDVDYSARPRVPYRPVRLAKRPLLVPRDYSAGFVPELLGLEQLFMGSNYRPDEPTKRLARLPSFPSSGGDVIVIDDVDTQIVGKIFKDVLQLSLVADTSRFDFDNLPPTTSFGNGTRYDDFTGGVQFPLLVPIIPIIPEPGTGSLVAVGLLGLALHRRARS